MNTRLAVLGLMTSLLTAFSSCRSVNRNSALADATSDGDLAAVADAVAKDLAPFVKTLAADTHFYHWAPRNRVTKNPIEGAMPTDEEVSGYVRGLIDTFWFQSRGSTQAMGEGFYMAIDPVATIVYGGADWVLIQSVIPEGTRIFNLEASGSLSEASMKQIIQKFPECGPSTLGVVSADRLACAPLSQEVFKRLQVFAFSYRYGASEISSCQREGERPAIVIRGKDVIRAGSIVAFTKNDFPEESTAHYNNRLIIEDIFRRTGSKLWPALDGKPLPPGLDMVQWMQKNLWGCAGTPMLR